MIVFPRTEFEYNVYLRAYNRAQTTATNVLRGQPGSAKGLSPSPILENSGVWITLWQADKNLWILLL